MHREPDGLRRWFVTVPAPFLRDSEALKQVNELLRLFDKHSKAALAIVRPAHDAEKFRVQMANLGKQTQKECMPVITKLMARFHELGMVWK